MVFWDQLLIRAFGLLTLLTNIIILVYVIDLISLKTRKKYILPQLWNFFGKRTLPFAFIISLFATGGSLIFSEILNFQPCVLCWFQRIFMYPQLLLTGLALFKKDKNIFVYLALLSLLGAALAGFHYAGQLTDTSALPCSALGYTQSCSENFFTEFGYITIPFMALSAFLSILVLWHLEKR